MKEIWQEQQDNAEPCPTDFKTKKECDAFFKRRKPKRQKPIVTAIEHSTVTSYGEPMSINMPFDNAHAWLDDEPWRKW